MLVSSAQPAISQSVQLFSCSYALYPHIQGSSFLLSVELIRPLIRVTPQGDIIPKSGSFQFQEVELPIVTGSQALLTAGASTSLPCFQLQAQYLGSPLCLSVCGFHRFLFSSIVPLSQAFLSFESTSLAAINRVGRFSHHCSPATRLYILSWRPPFIARLSGHLDFFCNGNAEVTLVRSKATGRRHESVAMPLCCKGYRKATKEQS